LAEAKNKETARIRVEDAHADLLLLATDQNGMWNSHDGCVEIMDALRKHKYPHQHELVVYENAGEPTPVPYVLPAGLTTARIAPRLALTLGGTLEGNTRAKSGAWEKIIGFFAAPSKN